MASTRVNEITVPQDVERKLVIMFGPVKAQRIIFVAVRRATQRAVGDLADVVQARLSIPKKYIAGGNRRAALRVKVEPSATSATGIIGVRRIALPLYAFSDKRITKKQGVTVRPDKTKPAIILKHAFGATVKSPSQLEQGVSHKGIFQRKAIVGTLAAWWRQNYGRADAEFIKRVEAVGGGPGTTAATPRGIREDARGQVTPRGFSWRLPIEEAMGPTILDLMSQDDMQRIATKSVAGRLMKELDGQVSRETKGRHKSVDTAWNAYQLLRAAV